MSLAEKLAENVRACFTGIWVHSCEHEDALVEIARLCHNESWRLATWDVDQGLRVAGQSEDGLADTAGADPLAAIRAVSGMATSDSASLLVLVNFHHFLSSAEVVQAVKKLRGPFHHGSPGQEENLRDPG